MANRMTPVGAGRRLLQNPDLVGATSRSQPYKTGDPVGATSPSRPVLPASRLPVGAGRHLLQNRGILQERRPGRDRFCPHPGFRSAPGGTSYKTGDPAGATSPSRPYKTGDLVGATSR